jgi:superfamily II DNA or RNA helicase
MEQLSRNCQIDAFNGITDILRTDAKCITKMFCGTGKSRVIREVVLNQKKDISIIVFPSLALIRQYTNDYLQTIQARKLHKILNISSEILDDFTSTTDPLEIRKFLKLKKQKIICITYQSLETLISNLGNTIIGLACFDEAHRTTSDGVKELIYNSEKYEKQVFFTATPINQNGITMFERDDVKVGDCGKLASEYTYLQGLRDGILSLFELRVDLYTEDTIEHMYESIARAILASGNQRVLTFHADTSENSSSDTSVLRFVDEKLFKKVYRNICEKEFPELLGKIKKITFIPITAETKNKDEILEKFDKCGDNEIYIVSSCRTIGEGVDTKKANMCVFVDPKSSINAIIQNIGRICRKVGHEENPATILIPVCINIDKYRECGEDYDKMDGVLREQLNDSENGDFNAVMNVCVALKQEDPELFELCLKYPSQFTDSERMHSLHSQRCDLGDEVDYCDIDEMIENGEPVEIYTSSIEEPIISHNMEESDESDECEDDIKRFYMISGDDDDDEEPTYYEIVSKDEKKREKLDAPTSKNRPCLNMHRNDEIKLLWRISSSEMNGKFGSAVIDCCVEKLDTVELWKEKCQDMCDFIDENGRTPNKRSKNPDEKKLGNWVTRQKMIYDPKGAEFSKERIKILEIWEIWTGILTDEKYRKFLIFDLVENWKNKHTEMCDFINSYDKRPSSTSKDIFEKFLGLWILRQIKNYDMKGSKFSKYIMKNLRIFQIWKETIEDEKYSKYLVLNPIQDWKNKHKEMCDFISKENKLPLQKSKEQIEKKLARWICNQKYNYNSKGTEFSKCIMKNAQIFQIWKETIEDEKYSKYLVLDFFEDWKNKHKEMCDFISKENKCPLQKSKEHIEKKLATWISTQKYNYNSKGTEFSKCIMKNSQIFQIWKETIEDEKYSKYLVLDSVEDWKNKHKEMCDFIEKNNKLPSSSSKKIIEKTLGLWIGTQKQTYDPEGIDFSKYIMKNAQIFQIWKETIEDEKYSKYLVLDSVEDWKNKYKAMCEFIDSKCKAPSNGSKEPIEKKLGIWVTRQKMIYDPKGTECSKNIMKNPKIWKIWSETLINEKYTDLLVIDRIQDWKNNHKKMCEFIDTNNKRPSHHSKNPEEKKLGNWIGHQKKNYNSKGVEFSKNIMKTPEIFKIWQDTLSDPKYKDFLNKSTDDKSSKIDSQKDSVASEEPSEVSEPEEPESPPSSPKKKIVMKTHKYTPSSQSESTAPKKAVVDSDYKLISRAWSIQNSKTTHQKLLEDPTEWYNYHDARDISFQGYTDQSQIPRNRVISYLEKKRKHRIPKILDLGCGRNNIEHHFTHINPNSKFTIIGYDHVAEQGVNSRVGNISDLSEQEPDETTDICIYSQSLMGSDKINYLDEGYRILRYNGEFVIADHIDIFNDVKEKLVGLGCNIIKEEQDSNESKWFLLIAQKV